jgi:hypothetical protein
LPKIQESSRLEEIAFIRDEIANMVWRIETVVPMAHGWSREGNIAALDLDAYLRAALPPPAPFHSKAAFRYNIMTTVRENGIPFVPEDVPNSNRQIQLRRAISRKPDGVWAGCQPWIPRTQRSGLLTHTRMTESVWLFARMKN